MNSYAEFLDQKTQCGSQFGFKPLWMPDFLFDFQKSLVEWALEKGRAAIFADCGLGKTPISLVWAENVIRKTEKRVLILTPLAVAAQICREGEKFGIEAHRSHDGDNGAELTVSNYEQLHHFNPADFSGVVCDESSILKSFNGTRRSDITAFMRKVPYRLLATATAAPNDYTELGTSSEALGYLGHMDMLNRFFKNDLNNSALGRYRGTAAKWRFKGHAEIPFWRWVCSWARAIRKPSDMGFSDDSFILPPLHEKEHVLETTSRADGMLFSLPAIHLDEQRDERRRTVQERCEFVVKQINGSKDQAMIWCHLNDEGDLLEKLLPDSVQVSGSDTDEKKEEALMAFADNKVKRLITKPKIGAYGLNMQNCNRVITFPSHSYEQYYQSVRRCWRFGQKRPVFVDIIASEGEVGVLKNLQRKSKQADKMFSNLVAEMNHALAIKQTNKHTTELEKPAWL